MLTAGPSTIGMPPQAMPQTQYAQYAAQPGYPAGAAAVPGYTMPM